MESMNIPKAANPNARNKLLEDIRNKNKLVKLKKTETKEKLNPFVVQ
jgi:hypothetical protein